MKKTNGQAAILIVFVLGMISVLIGLSLTKTGFGESIMGRSEADSAQAFYAANSGVEEAIYRIKNSPAEPYYSGEFPLGISNSQAKVKVSDLDVDGSRKGIVSEGYYKNFVRKIKTEIIKTTVSSPFHYAIEAGDGGLEFTKKGDITGNVYSNGDILGYKTGGYKTSIDGSVWAFGSISNLDISGDAQAGDIDTSCSIGGTPDETPAPQIDITNYFDLSVMQNYLNNFPTIPGPYNATGSLGNVTINGDLIIHTDISFTGPVWVTGSIDIKAKITLDPEVINSGISQIIVAEQPIIVQPTSEFSSTNGVFLLLISTYDPLTDNPSLVNICDDPYQSILINANVNSVLFYAPNGCLDLQVTASEEFIGSAVGKKIIFRQMQNGLKYNSDLEDAEFGLTKSGGWVISSFKEE